MFKSILVPIDIDQKSSVNALPVAADMAKKYGAGLTVLNVQVRVPSMVTSYLPEDFAEESDSSALEKLRALADDFKLGAGTDFVVRRGTSHHEILAHAESSGTDLILLASHHPDFSDYLLGSTAGQVVRHAQCSVLVLRL